MGPPSVSDAAADAAVGDAPLDALTAPDALPGRVPYHAIAVATGEVHTCAILDDHEVKCWGDNSFGQLGYGDTRRRGNSPSEMGDALPVVDLGTGRTALAIAASDYRSCAILDDGSLKCWGLAGEAGGVTNNLGDEPGEMGDHLPALDFGGRRAVHLGMADGQGCASMSDDTIWCWQDDQAPWQMAGLPAKRVMALDPGGAVVALYDDGTISSIPAGSPFPEVSPHHKVIAVAGSEGSYTCLLLDDGSTTCEVGDATFDGPANAIAIGVERPGRLCSSFADGAVRCQVQSCASPYECSSDGSFLLGSAALAVTSGGSEFACGLLADGNIKCWAGSPTSPWLGASVDFTTQADGGITYGAWRAVDLGTH